MRINNEELKFKIYNMLKKDYDDEIEEEDLKKVKTISINKKNQDLGDIIFEEKDFEVLKYVECLTLNMFEMNDEFVKQIALMKNLNCLILNHCAFKAKKPIRNQLKNLMITYPENLEISIFSEVLSLEMLQLVDVKVDMQMLKKYENLEYIYLYNSEIKNFEILEEFEKLKEVGLDGSNILEDVCDRLKSKNIEVHYKDEYLPV